MVWEALYLYSHPYYLRDSCGCLHYTIAKHILLYPSIWIPNTLQLPCIEMQWEWMGGGAMVTIIEVDSTVGFASRIVNGEVVWANRLLFGG